MQHLVHVVNSLAPGAIPNILRDLQPEFARHFRVSIVSLQPILMGDPALTELQNCGAKLISLDCHRLNVAMQYLRLRRWLHRTRPDVAHAHLGRAEVLTPLAAPKGTFTVATYHNVPEGHKWVTRLAALISERKICVRTFVSKTVAVAWRNGEYDTSNVIYNPVDIQRFTHDEVLRRTHRESLGIDCTTTLFISVGRLIPQKGHSDLLKAASELLKSGQGNFKVIIIGGGPLLKSLIHLVKSLDLGERVDFVGPQKNIRDWLSAADFFVFPSHFEGLGIAPLEAMASGCPVILSDFPAGREYLEHGKTGHVFAIKDINGLTALMSSGMIDFRPFALCATMAREGLAERFHPETVARQYINLYSRVGNVK